VTSRISGKSTPFGLRHVEDIGVAEAKQDAGVLLGDVLLGFLVLLAANADDGGKNANAFLALLHAAAKFFHVQKPATRVAVGICRAISSMFPKL
jgi:hypothetical protein